MRSRLSSGPQWTTCSSRSALADWARRWSACARWLRRAGSRQRAWGGTDSLGQLLGQLQALLPAAASIERLTTVRAAVGNVVRMIPVADIVFFQAVDKYVNVATADSEALIRVPLKDLLPQLDPDRFRQVSRSMVVNMACVLSAVRDDMGKVTLNLRGRADKPRVSPVYAHLFRQMSATCDATRPPGRTSRCRRHHCSCLSKRPVDNPCHTYFRP
ncbi:LytTR family DNA-binding domain-containing protein [Massilia timonae]|uniref:LytTR family DNA-binding domain-containing protein n=1 Tax=Massilia timonae TaxID=47229 RepID=UPI00351CC30F